MAVRYSDIPSSMQVLGGLYNEPELFDNEKYIFSIEDFTESFHRNLFIAFNNLYENGVKILTPIEVKQYFEGRPKQLAEYEVNNGDEYLKKLREDTQISSFNYYYDRMKKFTLFRAYNEMAGMNLSNLYDINNILDVKKKQKQEDWLDNTPIEDIAEMIDRRIEDIKLKYVNNANNDFEQAGKGALALVEELEETPEIGYPMYGKYINTIVRGARLGKFYLRSASTGLGKTRGMIADICNFGCDTLYDSNAQSWVTNGTNESCLYIATEQDLSEVQTMMLSFIADVDEEHILYGKYDNDEKERIIKAAMILENSNIYVKYLPDFSMKDVEGAVKMAIREFDTRYVAFDYIHSSMKILGEVSKSTGVKSLREDNILFMLGAKLKDICVQYGVFILSATQVNGGYVDAKVYDQNLLRGAKSLGDRIDCGMIMLPVEQEEKEKLQPILDKFGFDTPTIKISVYKNRRGRWKDILIWCKDRRATCKIDPMFVTDYNFDILPIEDLNITVKPRTLKDF